MVAEQGNNGPGELHSKFPDIFIDSDKLSAKAKEIENEYGEWFRKRLEVYRNKISENDKIYPEDKEWIFKAIEIAEYGHVNQFRKKAVNGEHPPYILHNLEMVERALQSGVDDPLLHVLIWLHDVPEDAPKSHKNTTPNDWIEYITDIYREDWDFDVFSPRGRGGESINQADALKTMLQAITSTEVDETSEEGLQDLAVYKAIKKYVFSNSSKPSDKEEKDILETVFNLGRIFETGLSSPVYLRLFLVKVLDVWQNFKDPDLIRKDKALRGMIAANLAHLFGWYGLESEIIQKVSLKIDIHTPDALSRTKDSSQAIKRLQGQFGEQIDEIIDWNKKNHWFFQFTLSKEECDLVSTEIDDGCQQVAQVSLSTFLDKAGSYYNSNLFSQGSRKDEDYPVPQFIMVADLTGEDRSRIDKLISYKSKSVDLTSFLAFSSLVNRFVEANKQVERVVYVKGNGRTHRGFVLRLRHYEYPTLVSLFRSADMEKFKRVEQLEELFKSIPEAGIFDGGDLKQKMSKEDWLHHTRGILAFSYVPNSLVGRQNRVVVLLDVNERRIIIAHGSMKTSTLNELIPHSLDRCESGNTEDHTLQELIDCQDRVRSLKQNRGWIDSYWMRKTFMRRVKDI